MNELRVSIFVKICGLSAPAGVKAAVAAGADAIGFSTVLEVIAAIHAGMQVLGLSVITNVHNPDRPVPAVVEDIIATAQNAVPQLETIILKVAENI